MLRVIVVVLGIFLGAHGQSCPGEQVWNECGSLCDNVCWSRDPFCAAVCEPKCECPRDTYWHSRDQRCYSADQCDALGLYDGGSTPYWATMTTTTTTMSPTTYGEHCYWCKYWICDANQVCTYGYATSDQPETTTPPQGYVTSTPRPGMTSDGAHHCPWCRYGICDQYGCMYGTTTPGWDQTTTPRYCDYCRYGECDENYECTYGYVSTSTPRPWTTTRRDCDWCRYGICDYNYDCTYGYDSTTAYPTPEPQNCDDERCLLGVCDPDGTCAYGCADNRYGWDCSSRCNPNCLHKQCDQGFGFCLLGCVNGTEGAFCDEYCPQGCNGPWQAGCDLSYHECSYDKICYQCGCQGYRCVDDGSWVGSAPVPSTSLLAVLLTAACAMLLSG